MECLFLQPTKRPWRTGWYKKDSSATSAEEPNTNDEKKIYRLGGYFLGGGIISPSTSRFEVPAGSVFVPCTL